jgi:hypothetical protein
MQKKTLSRYVIGALSGWNNVVCLTDVRENASRRPRIIRAGRKASDCLARASAISPGSGAGRNTTARVGNRRRSALCLIPVVDERIFECSTIPT